MPLPAPAESGGGRRESTASMPEQQLEAGGRAALDGRRALAPPPARMGRAASTMAGGGAAPAPRARPRRAESTDAMPERDFSRAEGEEACGRRDTMLLPAMRARPSSVNTSPAREQRAAAHWEGPASEGGQHPRALLCGARSSEAVPLWVPLTRLLSSELL